MKKKNKLSKFIRAVNTPVKGFDPVLNYAVLILAVFGIIMIGSATMGVALESSKQLYIQIGKQVVFVVIGFVAMNYVSKNFKLKMLKSNWMPIGILLILFLLLLCLAFSAVNGAHAWIRIPLGVTEMTLQPSEFAKILCILMVAGYLADRNPAHRYQNVLKELFATPVLVFILIVLIVWFVQDDFGSAFVIFLIFNICLLIPKHPQFTKIQLALRGCFWLLVGLMFFTFFTTTGAAMIQASSLKAYQKARFLSCTNPFAYRFDQAYQLVNALIAFSEGGFFGKGLGNSVRKYSAFPQANTDFILAIIVEELGWVGFVFMIVLYFIIIYRMLYYAKKMKCQSGRVILVGGAMYFMIHIFLNIGGVTGLIPLTGVPLPLVSAGGSSCWAMMLAVGLGQAVIAAYKKGEIG